MCPLLFMEFQLSMLSSLPVSSSPVFTGGISVPRTEISEMSLTRQGVGHFPVLADVLNNLSFIFINVLSCPIRVQPVW